MRSVLERRFAAQLLSGPPARSVEAVVERLLAVQAQDPRGARLSIRSRSLGLRAADVDRAFTDDRSLVVSWLNRGTLHLVRTADYWLLHPLTAPRLTAGVERGLRQLGVSDREVERGVALIVQAVEDDGPQTRAALRARLDAAHVPTEGQALVHLLITASLRGHIVRGPVIDGEHAFASAASWLGAPPPPVDRDLALATLARRYLRGHAPASARDLAKWAGITLADARRGLTVIRDDLDPLGDDLVALSDDRSGVTGVPAPRLLGSYDELLLGWTSRTPITGRHAGIVTTNGVLRPFALVDGRAVATWGLSGGTLRITPLERISTRTRAALVEDATDVLRFLDLPAAPAIVDTLPTS